MAAVKTAVRSRKRCGLSHPYHVATSYLFPSSLVRLMKGTMSRRLGGTTAGCEFTLLSLRVPPRTPRGARTHEGSGPSQARRRQLCACLEEPILHATHQSHNFSFLGFDWGVAQAGKNAWPCLVQGLRSANPSLPFVRLLSNFGAKKRRCGDPGIRSLKIWVDPSCDGLRCLKIAD